MAESRLERLAPWAGIVFALLSVVSAGMMLGAIPDPENADARILDYYGDTGIHVMVIAGGYLWALANIALLWFISYLRSLLGRAEGEPVHLSRFGFAGGLIFIILSIVASAGWTTVAGAIEVGGADASLDPDWMRLLPQFGFGLFRIPAVWAAIVLIYTTSIVASRTGVLPRRVARSGYILALIPLILITPIPMLAIPIWVLVVSIALLRRPPAAATA